MKQIILSSIIVLFVCSSVHAQNNNLGIGTGTPDASAMLDVLSTDKGLLVPRMTTAERQAIVSPANALLVYDTDSACFLYYIQPTTTWINLCNAFTETDPQVGSNSTNQIPKWDGIALVGGSISDVAGNVGIGTNSPTKALEVIGTGRFSDLAGIGNRMVIANTNGDLGTQAIPVNTDAQGLSSSASSTNRTINIAGGTGTTFSVADNDNSASNEIQALSITGNTVSLSNGGGSVSLADAGEFKRIGGLIQNTTDIANDDFVFGSTSLDGIAGTNDDNRFFFNKSKGAFRAGQASSVSWDDVNIGNNSTATGYQTTASGNSSTAIGESTTASGIRSTAMGAFTNATGLLSTAMGYFSTASGSQSTAMGHSSNASGSQSTAMGRGTAAPSYGETSIGLYTETYIPTSATSFSATDRLFVIGNGTSGAKSNALTVLKNGHIGVGTTAPDDLLHLYTATPQGNSAAGGIVQNDEVATLILDQRHSATNSLEGVAGAGSPAAMIDFRTNNPSTDRWSVGQIIGVADAGNTGYAGGLAFTTNPGGTDNPADSRNKGLALPVRMVIQADGNIGMGTTNPKPSAALEIESTTQGFLPPRMTNNERAAIASPAQGLIIYCSNCGTTGGEPQYYNGTDWVNLIGGTRKVGPPIVSTTPVTSITGVSAQSGGNATPDGGGGVFSRGVCWSTSPNPTTADNFSVDGSGSGSFSSSLTGLNPLTTYYVRAYANYFGVNYGNEYSFTTTVLSIGESYLGGIVAYILQPGDPGYDANAIHGLLAAPSDQSTGAEWGCYGTLLPGADGAAIGTGAQNTIDIEAGCTTAGIAADICANLTLNTYSDWFLPSKDELSQLYQNLKVNGFGAFGNNYYWSSTENDGFIAWTQDFTNGFQSFYFKLNTFRVRAVRAF